MRRALMCMLFTLTAACGGDMSEDEQESSPLKRTEQRLALFDYVASSSTNSASDPNTSADYVVNLSANETVMIGTCVLNEAAYSGDTYLRLYNPGSVEVAVNDDWCNGLGSKISYTAPAAGSYLIRAGCYSTGLCSGTVSLARRMGIASFNVSNTNNALINTFNKQYKFNAGDVVRISTCSYNSFGATASGDTYLRLYQNNGGVFTQVAANDTGPGFSCGAAAEIVYSIPASGYYQVRAGCAANTACGGTLAVYVE